MPYDPRPVSEGGNRGIDEQFSRYAPEGKYRIIGVDTFDGEDWLYKDEESLDEAVKFANQHGSQMNLVYVYDNQGRCVYRAGSF